MQNFSTKQLVTAVQEQVIKVAHGLRHTRRTSVRQSISLWRTRDNKTAGQVKVAGQVKLAVSFYEEDTERTNSLKV